jgi:hypothetical protein
MYGPLLGFEFSGSKTCTLTAGRRTPSVEDGVDPVAMTLPFSQYGSAWRLTAASIKRTVTRILFIFVSPIGAQHRCGCVREPRPAITMLPPADAKLMDPKPKVEMWLRTLVIGGSRGAITLPGSVYWLRHQSPALLGRQPQANRQTCGSVGS